MSLGAWGDEGNVCIPCQENGWCDEHPACDRCGAPERTATVTGRRLCEACLTTDPYATLCTALDITPGAMPHEHVLVAARAMAERARAHDERAKREQLGFRAGSDNDAEDDRVQALEAATDRRAFPELCRACDGAGFSVPRGATVVLCAACAGFGVRVPRPGEG